MWMISDHLTIFTVLLCLLLITLQAICCGSLPMMTIQNRLREAINSIYCSDDLLTKSNGKERKWHLPAIRTSRRKTKCIFSFPFLPFFVSDIIIHSCFIDITFVATHQDLHTTSLLRCDTCVVRPYTPTFNHNSLPSVTQRIRQNLKSSRLTLSRNRLRSKIRQPNTMNLCDDDNMWKIRGGSGKCESSKRHKMNGDIHPNPPKDMTIETF